MVCSPYSASDSISNSPSMLLNEMSGKTTLMVLAETPRVLVLAWVTGVGALAAPAGAARARATALARTATAPTVRGSLRPTARFPQLRIANPRVRAVPNRAPPEAIPADGTMSGRRLPSVEQRLAPAQNGAEGLVVRRLGSPNSRLRETTCPLMTSISERRRASWSRRIDGLAFGMVAANSVT